MWHSLHIVNNYFSINRIRPNKPSCLRVHLGRPDADEEIWLSTHLTAMCVSYTVKYMVGLDNSSRSQGGKNRAKNQDPEERRFQAMIAASRRPLLHDANVTPEALLAAFKELIASRHWFYACIVCANRSKIQYTSNGDVLDNVKKAGGAIGFLGVTMLGTNVQTFYKPLKRGVKVIEDLDRASREATAAVLAKLGQIKLPPIEG